MYRAQEFQTIGLLALGLAAIFAIARGFWLYRASLTWPTADGVITTIFTTLLRIFCTEVGTRISQVRKKLASFPNENCR